MAKGQVDPSKLYMSLSGTPIYGSTDGIAVVPDSAGVSTTHDGLIAVSGGDIAMALDPSMWGWEFEDFNGYVTIPDIDATFVNQYSPWVTESEAGTSPVKAFVADTANGILNLALSATSEAADMTLYWGDQLTLNSNNGPIMICRLALPAVGVSTDSRAWGFISAKGTDVDFDPCTNNAIFKVDGANLTLLVESDDNTTNDDDNSTGITLTAATHYEFMISMNPIHGASATDVRFFYRTTPGDAWTRLLSTTTFSFGANVACQPAFNVEKSAGTGTPGIHLDYAHILWKRV